jgi:hypothetical protein
VKSTGKIGGVIGSIESIKAFQQMLGAKTKPRRSRIDAACVLLSGLPGEVGKRLIRIRHAVRVLASSHRSPFLTVSGEQFV